MEAVPLLERERELARSLGTRRAVSGRGGVLLVEGPAGIGKSALVARAREAAHERNVAVAVARASSSSARTPSGSCASCSSRGCAG